MDEPRKLTLWQVLAGALALVLSGVVGAGPALAASPAGTTVPGRVEPAHDGNGDGHDHEDDGHNGGTLDTERDREDQDDGNDDHPARYHDDDDDLFDKLGEVVEAVADVLEEIAHLLYDLS